MDVEITGEYFNLIEALEHLWQNVRFGARQLRLNPGFATVAILSLALGVGANSAIFALIDAVRLRTLPVPHPEELAEVQIVDKTHCCNGNFTSRHSEMTYPQWDQVRDKQQAFSSIMAWSDLRFNLAQGGEVHFAKGLLVSGEFFKTLQVPAVLGRVLSSEDDRRGCGSPAAVLSYGFWQQHFGGEASAIGKKLLLDGHPFEVTGVTPASFFGVDVGNNFDIAVPICAQTIIAPGPGMALERKDRWFLGCIGRLKPGWTVEKASANLKVVSAGIFESTVPPNFRAGVAKDYSGYRLGAIPAGTGVSDLRSTYESPLYLLMEIAGLVLAIACANLANLMLARASARERELAIRLAIGAGRGQIIGQLLVESLLIAFIGAGIGAWLAQYLSRVLVALLSTGKSTMFLNLGTDWRMLGFTAGLAVLACLLFGLAPALRASKGSPADAMKSGRGQTAGREKFGLRRVLAASQMALSLMLLVGALLFAGSLRNLMTLDAGFHQTGVLVTSLDFRRTGYSEERRVAVYNRILEAFRATPGIDAAAIAGIIPISGNRWNDMFRMGNDRKELLSNFNRVGAGYFGTLGTPLLAGRDFNDRDTRTSPPVVIVDEAFGKKFLNSANPVGKTITVLGGAGDPDTIYQIAGLAKNMKYQNLHDDFTPTVFVAAGQEKEPDLREQYVLRSRLPFDTVTREVTQAVNGVDPSIAIEFKVLKTMVEDSLVRDRLMALLAGFFGALAAILAVTGLYGVVAYMVARRQNEIGIRMALGADSGNVLRMVMGEAGWLLALGLTAGVVLTALLARVTAALIYGMKPNDPVTIAAAAAGLAAVALIASYIPARRAARLDPMITLRAE